MWTCSGVVTDAKGTDIGTIEIAKKFSTALGTLTLGETAVYTAEKYTTIKFLCTIMDSTGNIVAKVHQPGLDPKKIEIEAGPGVDVLAITILASAVAAAIGSGSGGLAGAGIH